MDNRLRICGLRAKFRSRNGHWVSDYGLKTALEKDQPYAHNHDKHVVEAKTGSPQLLLIFARITLDH